MKNLLFILTLSMFVLAACSPSTDGTETVRKKGEEDPLLARYSAQLVANPTTQPQIDQNKIVNYLIDSLLDFQRTESGIYYQIREAGSGGHPNMNSRIIAHYQCAVLSGKVADASYGKSPLNFTLGGVITGWQETIPMLQKGGKGTFIVPSHLAYGATRRGTVIAPNSVLVFDIELIDFQ